MSFIATNNRIQITNTNNEVMFDTNNKMPAIVKTISGYIYANPTTRYKSYNLGTIPDGANFFLPMHNIKRRPNGGTTYSSFNSGYWECGIGSRITDGGWASIPYMQGNQIVWTYVSWHSTLTIVNVGSNLELQYHSSGRTLDADVYYKVLIGRVF